MSQPAKQEKRCEISKPELSLIYIQCWIDFCHITYSFRLNVATLIWSKLITASWIDMANYLKIKTEKMRASEPVLFEAQFRILLFNGKDMSRFLDI